MRPRLREACMKTAICLLFFACAAFAADDYPAKPIQMIVPFPAGGPADIVGRLYAQHLAAVVGQPVVTLNRDGASGSIGTAAAARAAPDGYTLAFGTTGTIVQMAAELFKHETGTDLLVVPFKGGQPATLALLSGEVDMIVNDLTALKSNLASGKLRALAVAHTSRLKLLPDVPTFAELGLPGVVSSTWWGIGVPVKTPEAIQARLRDATARILADPDYVGRLATMAVEPIVIAPQQASAFVAGEVRKWKAVAAAAK